MSYPIRSVFNLVDRFVGSDRQCPSTHIPLSAINFFSSHGLQEVEKKAQGVGDQMLSRGHVDFAFRHFDALANLAAGNSDPQISDRQISRRQRDELYDTLLKLGRSMPSREHCYMMNPNRDEVMPIEQ